MGSLFLTSLRTFVALAAVLAGVAHAQTSQPGERGGTGSPGAPSTLDPRRPGVQFASSGQAAGEDGAPITVDVTVDVGWLQPITVPYKLKGSAVAGVDYTIDTPSPLVFAAGQRTITLTLTPIDDGFYEPVEDTVIRLRKPDWAGLGSPRTHVVSWIDDDCVTPDDFNHCEGLLPPWNLVDSVGDASLSVSGVGTADAWANLGVPAGLDHLPTGGTLSARIAQPAADGDCTFGVRIDSELTVDGQHQGFLVSQDAGEWMRFEVYSTGGGPSVFLGSTTGSVTTPIVDQAILGAAPYYLRVQRSGSDWTFGWSDDGLAWNDLAAHAQVLAVTEVALYAGNSGGGAAPAHTASFDWLQDLDHPFGSEDGAFSGSGPYTLTAIVNGGGQVLLDPDQPTYTCSDVVTLTAVADPCWIFDHWEGDLSGSVNPETLAMTTDRTVTAVFVPDVSPPVISNVVVTPGQTTALVTWDTSELATSRVDYGLTSSYGSFQEDPSPVTSHAVLLTGLLPATLYHYQACSTDACGTEACTADATFQTLTGSGLVSDDFNHCEGLIAPWTYLDPIGDGSMQVVGVGTDDAWLQLAVPAGSTHLPFDAVLPGRAVQSVNDVDFQFEVKFESALAAVTQLQGVTIEQDGLNWIRFDLYRSGGGTFAYVGSTTAGSTSQEGNVPIVVTEPMYMRVTRVGDDWTMEWSDDPGGSGWSLGASFNFPVVANQIGLYAGNATGASAPAHVASVDWFQDTSAPIVTEDGSFSGSGPFTLTTNTTGSGSVTRDPDQADYTCSDVVTLTATGALGWDFDHWEDDLAGNQNPETIAMTTDRTVTAVFVQDTTPPAITNVVVVPSSTGATVTWDTDEPATSRVDYGLTSSYGMFVEDPTLVTSHSIPLTGLVPSTLYHFSVTSEDDGGQSSSTSDDIFLTLSDWTGFSDDFNQCGGVPSWWTFVDPVGDVPAPFVQGVGTSDAQLVMSVPGGVQHAAYDTLTAPQLLQTVNDVDFDLEVKYESSVTSAYQIQGVLVKQDDTRWLRFDFYSNGSTVRLFAGSTTANDTTGIGDFNVGNVTQPLWLGVERVGDQWTVRWSTNGADWTTVVSGVTSVLTVNQVGLYVGNEVGGSSPAHTMIVDYFMDLGEPISPEDGFYDGGGPYTLTTFVDPPGTGSVVLGPDQPTYDCSTLVTLTGQGAPGYVFDSWSGDLAGSVNPEALRMVGNKTATAHFVLDMDPPVIDDGPHVSVTSDTATISWGTVDLADSLVDYGLSASYTDQVYDPTWVTEHVVELPGLDPDTEYHYEVTTSDGAGSTMTGDATFVTAKETSITSDDFNHPNLDLGTWQWVDPLAGSGPMPEDRARLRLDGAGSIDARLEIEIPSGAAYSGGATHGAARVMQAILDEDFELEAKFEPFLSSADQAMGLIVEEDADTFLRFDFQHTGSELRILRETYDAGGAANSVVTTVQAGAWNGAALWMRVLRTGNDWTQSFSVDGTNWTPNGATFSLPVTVSATGVGASNGSSGLPGVISKVDYFFTTWAPIDPEDFGSPSDATSPFIYATGGSTASDTAIRVQWGTDEPSTSTLVWGLSAGVYDQGSLNGATLVYEDSLLAMGLLPDTTYHFQVQSQDVTGNPVSNSVDFTATTAPAGQDGKPSFEIWYGQPDGMGDMVQRFGHLGTGQTWVNVLGNVQDSNGVIVDLYYTVNGGSQNPLSMGQGGFTPPVRLVDPGDFNCEILASSLDDDSIGMNEVLITAVDDDGFTTVERVWIDYDADGTWPETTSIDWSTVTDLQDVIQVVDGRWEVDPTGPGGTPGLRNSWMGTAAHGYDRLFLIGDGTWDDYEFSFPVTVNALNPAGFYPGSGSHAIGVIIRWPGHTGGSEQPRNGFFPLGGLYAYRWYDLGVNENWQAWPGSCPVINYADFFMQVELGKTYIFKGQCETQGAGFTTYRMKSWESTSPEPPGWWGEMTTDCDIGAGSLLFLNHEVDATYGNISIVPLN